MMTEFPKIQSRFDAALAIINAQSAGEAAPSAEALAELEALRAEVSKANAAAEDMTEKAKVWKREVKTLRAETATSGADLTAAQERVDALEKEVAEKVAASEAQREAMVKQIDALDKARAASEEEVAQARQQNKHLLELNQSLRDENKAHVGNPELINEALIAELNQIKAQREIDLEEVNGILQRMTPLVEGA